MLNSPAELHTDLVLVGGGHSHALLLRRLGMRGWPAGARVTLISPDSHTPYSGMLPGLIAGHYAPDQVHIDLDRLCAWAGVRFIRGRVSGLDPQARLLRLAGRPALGYDLCSLDIGRDPLTVCSGSLMSNSGHILDVSEDPVDQAPVGVLRCL